MGRKRGPGTVRKVKGGWEGDWTDNAGKRHRRLLGRTELQARKALRDLIQARDGGYNLEEVHAAYLLDLEVRVGAVHFQRTRTALATMLPSLGGVLSPQALQVWIRRRLQEGVAHRTVNIELAAVRQLCNWAVRLGYLTESPIRGVRPLPEGPRHQRTKIRAWTDEEYRRVRAASLELGVYPELWEFLAWTGCRVGDAMRLRWKDIEGGWVTFTGTKENRDRRVPYDRSLPERTANLVWPGLTHNRIRHALTRVSRHAGLGHLQPHGARKFFATRLVAAGVPLAHAQRLLGHSTPELTARVYVQLEEAALQESVRKLEDARERRWQLRLVQ